MLEPEGWWGWFQSISPPTNQKNIHELTTPFLNHYYKIPHSPSRWGHAVLGACSLEGISPLWPPLSGKATKLFISTCVQVLIQLNLASGWGQRTLHLMVPRKTWDNYEWYQDYHSGSHSLTWFSPNTLFPHFLSILVSPWSRSPSVYSRPKREKAVDENLIVEHSFSGPGIFLCRCLTHCTFNSWQFSIYSLWEIAPWFPHWEIISVTWVAQQVANPDDLLFPSALGDVSSSFPGIQIMNTERDWNEWMLPEIPWKDNQIPFFFFFLWNAWWICLSSLCKSHANLLCIIPA